MKENKMKEEDKNNIHEKNAKGLKGGVRFNCRVPSF
jgi:hypothetical protein